MGYHSDVRAIIYGPTETMMRFVTASKLSDEFKKVFTEFIGDLRIYTVNAGLPADAWSVLEMACENVKWYPEFSGVKMWHAFMRSIEDEEDWKDLSYEFVRIGEEHGDVEWERSDNCEYNLEVTRPVAEVNIARSHITQGFPNETTTSDETGETDLP